MISARLAAAGIVAFGWFVIPDFGASSAHAGHVPTWNVLTVDADWLKSLLDRGGEKTVVVDVRSTIDYRQGHIPGARSLSLDEPAERFRELPRGGELIVLYCDCPMTEINPAYQFLRFQGYPRVLVLDGGLAAWVARGYPLKK